MGRPPGAKNRCKLQPLERKAIKDRLLPFVDEAIEVKVNGMRSTDEKIRQEAATDILNRVYGRAPQALEVDAKGDLTLNIRVFEKLKSNGS